MKTKIIYKMISRKMLWEQTSKLYIIIIVLVIIWNIKNSNIIWNEVNWMMWNDTTEIQKPVKQIMEELNKMNNKIDKMSVQMDKQFDYLNERIDIIQMTCNDMQDMVNKQQIVINEMRIDNIDIKIDKTNEDN